MTTKPFTRGELAELNLDAYNSPDEMTQIIERLEEQTFVGAQWLLVYAVLKREAMKHRLAGRIQRAIAFETICEDVYFKIPTQLQW